jgi:hypothetical protein
MIMQKIPRLSFIVDHLLQQPIHVASVNVAVGELVSFRDEEIQAQWSRLVGDTNLSQVGLTIQRILQNNNVWCVLKNIIR